MEKELKKAFCNAKYEQDLNLSDDIWQGIVLYNKRVIRIKLWSFSALGIVSLFGLMPAIKMLIVDVTQSGFYTYLSLAFSRGNLSYWKEITYSIAESLPAMSIAIAFSLLFLLFLSIKNATKQIIRGQLILTA